MLDGRRRTTSPHNAQRRPPATRDASPRPRRTGLPGAHLGDDGQRRDEDAGRAASARPASRASSAGSAPVTSASTVTTTATQPPGQRPTASRLRPRRARASARRARRAELDGQQGGADELRGDPGQRLGVLRRAAAARQQVTGEDAARVLRVVRDDRPLPVELAQHPDLAPSRPDRGGCHAARYVADRQSTTSSTVGTRRRARPRARRATHRAAARCPAGGCPWTGGTRGSGRPVRRAPRARTRSARSRPRAHGPSA